MHFMHLNLPYFTVTIIVMVIVIPFAMGTYQGDPLGGALFALAPFKALHSIVSHFSSCLFPSIIDDIHIIDLPSIASFTFEFF
jgi:hypothetical protein